MSVALGKDSKVYTSAAGSVWNQIPVDSGSVEKGYEKADTSHFNDAAARMAPSLDVFKGSFGGKWDEADAGCVELKAAINNRTLLFIKILPNGTNGHSAQCAVGPLKIDSKQGPDAVRFDCPFENASGAAPTVI